MAASHTLLLTLLVACTCALASCDNVGLPAAPETSPADAPVGNALEFRGQRACVDCLGIDAWLRLGQRGEEQRYTLVEIYRTEVGARRFEETGQWQSSGNLLRLRSGDGGERVYTLLPDNRLQAADTRGLALPAMADEILVPTSYSNER